jgi:hypothetical protein
MIRTGLFGAIAVIAWAGTACVGGWVDESGTTERDLYAVFGVSNSEVFAVGAGGTVLHRENGAWTELDSGTTEDLYGVWGTSGEHIVVVGDNCVALEYNGPIEPPEEGEPPPDLRALDVSTCGDFRGISGPTDEEGAFVVGERTLSQWYGGAGLANGRDFTERMQGVSMVVNDEIHAVGEDGAYYRKHDGSWSDRVITICGVELVDGVCPEGHEAMPILWDVFVSSGGDGAAVGSFGGVWRIPAPEEGDWEMEVTDFSNDLRAAHGFVDSKGETTVYAVGQNGVAVKITPEKVIREAPGTHDHLYGVWVSDDGNHVYAVGEAGTVAHFTK